MSGPKLFNHVHFHVLLGTKTTAILSISIAIVVCLDHGNQSGRVVIVSANLFADVSLAFDAIERPIRAVWVMPRFPRVLRYLAVLLLGVHAGEKPAFAALGFRCFHGPGR